MKTLKIENLNELTPKQFVLHLESLGVVFEVVAMRKFNLRGEVTKSMIDYINANLEEVQCFLWCRYEDGLIGVSDYDDTPLHELQSHGHRLVLLATELCDKAPFTGEAREAIIKACMSCAPFAILNAIAYMERCLKHCDSGTYWQYREQPPQTLPTPQRYIEHLRNGLKVHRVSA